VWSIGYGSMLDANGNPSLLHHAVRDYESAAAEFDTSGATPAAVCCPAYSGAVGPTRNCSMRSLHPAQQLHPRHPSRSSGSPWRGPRRNHRAIRHLELGAHVGFKLADGHVLDAAPGTCVSIHTVVDDPGTQYYRVDCLMLF
jgi:hypothetical protein